MMDKKWVFTYRTKSKIPVRVPLSNKALGLVAAYSSDGSESIFNVPSNQKTNAYLKEIGCLCGIEKNITTHTGRRTFATYALTKGVSIDVVSSLLGHSKLSTTQLYAKKLPIKVLAEMEKLT